MGNVSSAPDEGGSLYLRDPSRLSISSIVITSPRRRSSLNIVPNAFPPTRVSASRLPGDNAPIEFVLDSEQTSGPGLLLKLTNDDELIFKFFFVMRQSQQTPVAIASDPTAGAPALDSQINGLTWVYASSPREVETLVTREFQADPNLHKNTNVELVGDFSTGGSPSVAFEWSWRWKPPRLIEDKGGGWRNSCSFVEYDARAHRLLTLASFTFYVANTYPSLIPPASPPPTFLSAPPKLRATSAQSVESRISSAQQQPQQPDEPSSPVPTAVDGNSSNLSPPAPMPLDQEPIKVDISCPRPGDDTTLLVDDGPLFRATIKALELKTNNMRGQVKKLLKKAEHFQTSQAEANDALAGFMDALKEVAAHNPNAVQPAIDHYFDKIAKEILSYERGLTSSMQKLVIDPISKLYQLDIKQADTKKRDFEEESKDFYAYVGRYLGQRTDSVKAKQSDNKYQNKRKMFELKRFDYSAFIQDLSGGRKEQEVLSHLTKYANLQTASYLDTAKRVESLLPQLSALSNEVAEADKEYQYLRCEREERRRILEKSNYAEGDINTPVWGSSAPTNGYNSSTISSSNNNPNNTSNPNNTNNNNNTSNTNNNNNSGNNNGSNNIASHNTSIITNNTNTDNAADSEMRRADSTGSQLKPALSLSSGTSPAVAELSRMPGSLTQGPAAGSPQQNAKFRGIRDLEENQAAISEKNTTRRKEGLLWALSRPGGHVDPRAALNKQGWHKFWIVLDQGKLSEYSNWKQKLDLHMEPIDLRLASVRGARDAERRFCFEVITPHFKRVYQSTSEEDMNSWIMAINNALQSAVEGRSSSQGKPPPVTPVNDTAFKRDIGSVLTGKSSSVGHASHHHHMAQMSASIPLRRTTVGARPATARSASQDENPDRLLQMLRDNDQGNNVCADCGSKNKVEWVSINLAAIVCIECSGIHRSLGTHISKIRSLTLDTTSFTPDIIELLLLVGNRVSNMVFEARLGIEGGPVGIVKPGPQATREQRLRFITAKYVDKVFVEPISPTLSRYATPDETLLAGIKKNEIQQTIYGLALGANPNATDKSRGTHAIFLALAAADPASPAATPLATPGGGGTVNSSAASLSAPSLSSTATAAATNSSSSTAVTPAMPGRVPFPAAELLFQNGAEIPATMPAFPLSPAALAYIEAKRGRLNRAGAEVIPSSYDGISIPPALPAPVVATGLAFASSLAPGESVSPSASKWDPARLQKRLSAGGRLAKSPIPER